MIYFILGVPARGGPRSSCEVACVGPAKTNCLLLLGSFCCRFLLEVYNSHSSAQLPVVALLLFFLHSLIPL